MWGAWEEVKAPRVARLALTCQHCKHSWVPRGGGKAPRRCPECGNNWRLPYQYRTEKRSALR